MTSGTAFALIGGTSLLFVGLVISLVFRHAGPVLGGGVTFMLYIGYGLAVRSR